MNTEENVLVSYEERERIASKAKEYGKQDGITIKVINFKEEIPRLQAARKKNPIISLITIKEDPYKNNLSAITYVKDAIFGIHYGIPAQVLPDGNIRWRRIYIEENYSFNLMKETDCMEYLVMRMHPDVEGSPFQNASPKYRIHDEEREAEKISLKATYTRKAFAIVDDITGKNMVYFCRNLGVIQESDKDLSVNVLKSRLNAFAMENAEILVRRYEQESRSLREIFKTGLALSIVKDKGADGYEYNGRLLGLHEDAVIRYMKENPEVNISLSREIEENDKMTIDIQKEEQELEKKRKKEPEIKDPGKELINNPATTKGPGRPTKNKPDESDF